MGMLLLYENFGLVLLMILNIFGCHMSSATCLFLKWVGGLVIKEISIGCYLWQYEYGYGP